MIHYNDIDIHSLPDVPLIRTNKKLEYINLECGFDIETTSTKIDDEKVAFMYVWMFGLGHGEPVIYGRTWEEFKSLCMDLKSRYGLFEGKRLIIYVHNLSYEFQFIKDLFQWKNVFASGERKPLKALTTDGIEFRDSYILSGYSLAKTAENLAHHKIEKLDGDLDYKLVRTHETPLTEKELAYCNNDIEIITAYIKEQIQINGDINKIPLTNTGRVRKFVKDKCYFTSKNHRKSNRGKYYRYRKIMDDLTLKKDDYIQLKRAFMGGFTHANALYSGEVLENVSSVDFTSAYPSVMLSEKFPMSRPKNITVNSLEELKELSAKYGLLFDVRFSNIRSAIPQENYISESKCFELSEPVINNGRIYSAETLAMTITNVDFEIIEKAYDWDEIQVANVKMFHMSYLPKSIIESVLELYEKKTVLKGVENKEVEYMLSKGMLNSIYGMTVTDIIRDEHIYDGEWNKEPADYDEQIDKYNTSKNRFLYYPWGVWITAYARRNLWTGIIACEHDYVYSDTDSLKILNYEEHTDYINHFNKVIEMKMRNMCKEYKINPERLSPKNQKGEIQLIGIWDFEGTYPRFKTLGAKRYLVEEDGKLYLTVAGLSKQNGINYMIEKCKGDYSKVFKMFNNELYIPAERTGKMTHTYIDFEKSGYVVDYRGKKTFIKTLSGVHLSECDFTLSVSKKYGDFIHNLRNGYIYKGVDYI